MGNKFKVVVLAVLCACVLVMVEVIPLPAELATWLDREVPFWGTGDWVNRKVGPLVSGLVDRLSG